MEQSIVNVIISTVIASILAPVILLLINRLFSKRQDDSNYAKTLQEITEKAIEDLKQEKQDSEKRDEKNKEEMEELKNQITHLELMYKQSVLDFRVAISVGEKPIITEWEWRTKEEVLKTP